MDTSDWLQSPRMTHSFAWNILIGQPLRMFVVAISLIWGITNRGSCVLDWWPYPHSKKGRVYLLFIPVGAGERTCSLLQYLYPHSNVGLEDGLTQKGPVFLVVNLVPFGVGAGKLPAWSATTSEYDIQNVSYIHRKYRQ